MNLHLFADGKDSRPHSVLQLLTKLRQVTEQAGVGALASLCGRHFALDRDSHFDRTQRAYDAITGTLAPEPRPVEELVNHLYDASPDQSDEYLPPISVAGAGRPVRDNDALIFIDFREDSIRQLAGSFIEKEFDKFPVKQFQNLYIATMTEYTKHFKVPVAFPPEEITKPLGKVISESGLTQLLIAETETYAHVTYFFNGYRDEPFPGQSKMLIPSRNVESHDKEPQMMAFAIADRVVQAMQKREFDVIILNFANADMVAHTGNFAAAVIAVQTVDEQLGRIVKGCEETGSYLVVTADHGNAEVMIDAMTGSVETTHDLSPVPVYVLGPEFKRAEPKPASSTPGAIGILSDVAPTVLELLKILKPSEMTGQSLLPFLQ